MARLDMEISIVLHDTALLLIKLIPHNRFVYIVAIQVIVPLTVLSEIPQQVFFMIWTQERSLKDITHKFGNI